ncbi:MAG: hypothetical protein KF773_23880 [Deltaproteobacteria bacterium]|nr:hypothetical protein [Deltaproteobacteria bacterium]MCW5807663.1 hypothetical protein [Deltaproteobacteria bacterium]
MSNTSKNDLLRFLNQQLAANSNQPEDHQRPNEPTRPHKRVAPPPVRTHRALRPRRRS